MWWRNESRGIGLDHLVNITLPPKVKKDWLRPYEIYGSDVISAVQNKDQVEIIRIDADLELSVFWKRMDSFFGLLVLCKNEPTRVAVSHVFKVPKDLYESEDDATPLSIMEAFVDHVGFDISIGERTSRFIIREQVPFKGGKARVFEGAPPKGHEGRFVMYAKPVTSGSSHVDCALCFGVDETLYRRLLRI